MVHQDTKLHTSSAWKPRSFAIAGEPIDEATEAFMPPVTTYPNVNPPCTPAEAAVEAAVLAAVGVVITGAVTG